MKKWKVYSWPSLWVGLLVCGPILVWTVATREGFDRVLGCLLWGSLLVRSLWSALSADGHRETARLDQQTRDFYHEKYGRFARFASYMPLWFLGAAMMSLVVFPTLRWLALIWLLLAPVSAVVLLIQLHWYRMDQEEAEQEGQDAPPPADDPEE